MQKKGTGHLWFQDFDWQGDWPLPLAYYTQLQSHLPLPRFYPRQQKHPYKQHSQHSQYYLQYEV